VQDRPSAPELLAAVASFLMEDVLPRVPAEQRFGVRVAANSCAVCAREALAGPAAAAAERERMQALLALAGEEAPAEESVAELQAAAAVAIRSGRLDGALLDARDVLRESVQAKLAVAHPGYDDFSDDGRDAGDARA
jgi:hypothetical protein